MNLSPSWPRYRWIACVVRFKRFQRARRPLGRDTGEPSPCRRGKARFEAEANERALSSEENRRGGLLVRLELALEN